MKSLIFYDTTSNDTQNSIKDRGIGASEYQFYNLIENITSFSNEKNICFNQIQENLIIKNNLYTNYNFFLDTNFDDNSIILIQRFFPLDQMVRNKIFNYKTFLWIHDIPGMYTFAGHDPKINDFYHNNPDCYKIFLKENFVDKKSIYFILNSYHTKQMFIDYLYSYNITIEEERLNVIYNILYEDEFLSIKNKPSVTITNQLVYASAWQKGIEDVISVFDYIIQKDNTFIMVLMNPGYGMERYDNYISFLKTKYPHNIVIKNSLCKKEYSEIIKESLCVFTSRFNETFGCIFAESYYLGTPVIADIGSGAVKEIIDKNYIVNYDDKEQVFKLIKEIEKKRKYINIQLQEKFLYNKNINIWKNLLL